MENEEENKSLLPDRDIFGFEKQSVPNLEQVTPELKPDLKAEYAGLGIRFLAYILDVAIVIFPMYYIEMACLGEDHNTEPVRLTQAFIDLIVWVIYYGAMESSALQATLGKRMCNLIVVDENGKRLAFQKAALRYLSMFLSIIPLGFGIWAINYHPKKQGWHDSLTGCFVIKSPDDEEEPAVEGSK